MINPLALRLYTDLYFFDGQDRCAGGVNPTGDCLRGVARQAGSVSESRALGSNGRRPPRVSPTGRSAHRQIRAGSSHDRRAVGDMNGQLSLVALAGAKPR